MRSIDLGVELGAETYVFWGGREGVETNAAKDPQEALKWFRDALNFLCEYVRIAGILRCKFALEPKPNEPRGDIFLPTIGHMLAFIYTLDHPDMVGLNPEVAHDTMAGLDFSHGVAQALEAGKLFHIDLNGQKPGRFDQDLRFGSEDLKGAFFLVKLLEDAKWHGHAALRQPRLPHRGRAGRVGLRRGQHAHVSHPQGEGRALQRRRRDSGSARRARVARRRRPDARVKFSADERTRAQGAHVRSRRDARRRATPTSASIS